MKIKSEIHSSKREAPLLIAVIDSYDLAESLNSALSKLPISYRILITGKPSKKSLENCYFVKESEVEKFFTFASMVLFFSASPNRELVKKAVEKSSVPILPSSFYGAKNYKGPEEEGNCFQYSDDSLWSVFASVVRAVETHNFPYDWRTIIKSAKKTI